MRHGIKGVFLAFSLCGGRCDDPDAPAVAGADGEPLSLAEAERIALARVPGGTVEDIERDFWRGKPVIEVEVRAKDGREHELVVDEEGRIVAEEIDD